MPGTIQLSAAVLGLRTQLEEGNDTRLSIKVVMGKRQYQSMNRGDDFSFPVMSLRENLIVMLHDADGNQILQTEIKTVLVVEKGSWDDTFPLEDGGYVHMKLQFSLNEDERQRIRNMRESALKRKRGEQQKDDLMSSVSGQHGNTTRSLLQGSEVSKESLQTRSPLVHSPERQVASEVGLDPKSGSSRSTALGNVYEHSFLNSVELEEVHVHNTQRKSLLEISSSNAVWKMISTFEKSQPQRLEPHVHQRTKSLVPKSDVERFLERTPSEGSDINKLKSPQTMSKSFSSGMLSEISSQQNPRFFQSTYPQKQEVQQLVRTTKWETMPKDNPYLDLKIGSGKKKAIKMANDDSPSSEPPPSSSSHSSAAMASVKADNGTAKAVTSDGSPEHVIEREGTVHIEVKRNPAILTIHENLNSFGQDVTYGIIPKGGFHFDARIAPGRASDEVLPLFHDSEEMEESARKFLEDEENPSSDRRDGGGRTSEWSAIDHLQLSQKVDPEAMPILEIRNEEHTSMEETQLSRNRINKPVGIEQPCSPCANQHGLSSHMETEESKSEGYRSYSDEKSDSRASNETVKLSTYFESEECPFGSLNDWTPRHICTTTGSRQLRDLVGCYNNYGEMHLIATHTLEANKERVMHDDTSTIEDKDEKNSCVTGKPNHEISVRKVNGGLIEQGVRIAIVIVACGTLLFNAKPRKPRRSHS